MFGHILKRRAVGLLGAAAVTGVLSVGVLSAGPASAETRSVKAEVTAASSSLNFSSYGWSYGFSGGLANGLKVRCPANGL